jgi:hypothetical protein
MPPGIIGIVSLPLAEEYLPGLDNHVARLKSVIFGNVM